MGNLHLRFDEGRVGRAQASPSLLLYPSDVRMARPRKKRLDTGRLLMEVARHPAGVRPRSIRQDALLINFSRKQILLGARKQDGATIS